MARHIAKPTIIEAAGTGGKIIREFAGLVNTETTETSIARMSSPQGWEEPAQRPDFAEYTLVLEGKIRIETENAVFDVGAGELFIAEKGDMVKYSTPYPGGAEYVAVCLPAFSPETVHRLD
jgi:quercetin dioxygenase-like cupin family protein